MLKSSKLVFFAKESSAEHTFPRFSWKRDINNLYGCGMSQSLPVQGFKCVEETSKLN